MAFGETLEHSLANLSIGAEYCDLGPSSVQAGVEFTFFWKHRERWEGRNYRVEYA